MKHPWKSSLVPYGVSVFTEFTALAAEHGAINLSQGFPGFDGPAFLFDAARQAMEAGHNQYAPSHGVPALRRAVAAKVRRFSGLDPDEDAEVTVFCGATEALFSSIMALVEPGEEVVLFEPAYDSYAPCVTMAGGTPRFVPLRPPGFRIDEEALDAAVGPRTKMIVVNTPMNPTGRVFDRRELRIVAAAATAADAYVLTDEVYEHLTYDGREHVSLATLDGMWPRTVTISSTAKTFSMTGWKIGYAVAAAPLSRAIRRAHQFVTFATATPLQHAMARALESGDAYYREFLASYERRRDVLLSHLEAAGFAVVRPQGTYYVMADIAPLGFGDDVEFCRMLPREIGVAAIPVSAFYEGRRGGRGLVRFAFCKRVRELEEAGARLRSLGKAGA